MKTYIAISIVQATPMTRNAFMATKGEHFVKTSFNDLGYLVVDINNRRYWVSEKDFNNSHRSISIDEHVMISNSCGK